MVLIFVKNNLQKTTFVATIIRFALFFQSIFKTLNKIKMKLRLLFMALATAGILASCNNAPKGDEATVDAEQEAAAKSGETMAVDVSQSEVTWTGTKPVGAHYGTFKLASGEVSTENGMVTGGEFVIDVN